MVDNPIHVVHIMPQLAFAGAELQLYTLIVNSDSTAVVHEVVYYEESNRGCVKLFADAGIKLTRIHRNRRQPLRFLCELSRTIRACKADIVHCWLFSGNIWGRWAAILAGTRNILVAYRSCELPRARALRFFEMLSPTKRVHHLANSRAVAKSMGRSLHVSADKFTIVYNGTESERFDIPGDKKALRESLRIPSDSKVAVMIGRLVREKNYPMLLNLAHRCKEEELPLHFIIAGKGGKEQELHDLADDLGLRDIVHFVGVRQDIPFVLKSSDYFCFTSLSEGFPNVLLEAMAAGLPIVSTNFASAGELITDKHDGRLVPIDDVDAALKVLREYLKDGASAKRLGENARNTVKTKFAVKNMVDATYILYRKLAKQPC